MRWPPFDEITGFFDPRAMAALLLHEVSPGGSEWAALVESYRGVELKPLEFPLRSAHQGGLNFSRSWGLWALYEGTGDERYRAAYDEHMNTMLKDITKWSRNYRSYGHWVGQFGLFAYRVQGD